MVGQFGGESVSWRGWRHHRRLFLMLLAAVSPGPHARSTPRRCLAVVAGAVVPQRAEGAAACVVVDLGEVVGVAAAAVVVVGAAARVAASPRVVGVTAAGEPVGG